MATLNVTSTVNSFRVIHPLDDVVEQKCSTEGLGKIKMTRAVRISLGVLQHEGGTMNDPAPSEPPPSRRPTVSSLRA